MKSGLRRAFRNQAPVPMSGQGIYRLSDLALGASSSEALQRCYGVMSTVYSCVSLRAESGARPDWHLYRKQPADARRRYATTDTGSDQRTEVISHAALSLINQPNDFFSRFKLFELDQMYMDLTGEYYWIIARDGGANFPTGIWPVRPDRMTPVPDPDQYLLGWIYTSPDGREKVPLDPDQVIQSALPNPLDPMHGLGPVQSLLVQVDAYRYSAEWNRNFFMNSAIPNGVVTVPGAWDDKEWLKFTTRWRETHRGVGRAHRVAVLEDGATWTPNQMSVRDMDFEALQNLSRDIVREAFRMPKVMLGVSDDVNRANAQTGMEVFAAWSTVPPLDRKRDMLNKVFLPMFGSTGQNVEFDYTTPVPPNREEDRLEMVAKANAAAALVTAGYDPHDVLEVIGLPDMDVVEQATQAPALPPNWVPATPAAPDAPAPPPGGAGDDVTNRLIKMLGNGHIPVGSGRR